MFASSRHGHRPSSGLNKFFDLTINLIAMTIRRFCGKPAWPSFQPRLFNCGTELQTCTASFNSPQLELPSWPPASLQFPIPRCEFSENPRCDFQFRMADLQIFAASFQIRAASFQILAAGSNSSL
jgi:hypothetical protein